MGNALCCRGGFRRHDIAAVLSEPLDEGLGHSFCYVRPDVSLAKVHSEEYPATTTYRTISGASVSANTSTPLSTSFVDFYSYSSFDRAAAFESSDSFTSVPLQPVPRFDGLNGLNERGFMSGPIERGFVSGPLYSGNLEKFSGGEENLNLKLKLKRSFSHGGFGFGIGLGLGLEKKGLIKGIGKAIARKVSWGQKSIVAPVKGVMGNKEFDWMNGLEKGGCLSSEGSLGLEDDDCLDSQDLQWAQGKAGEDRVHVVISEENGLVFVGIYDGFNGPDAPDFLLSNLYPAVQKELKGLLWDDTPTAATAPEPSLERNTKESNQSESREETVEAVECCSNYDESESYPNDLNLNPENYRGKKCKSRAPGAARKWEESQRRWKCEWDRERLELDQKLKEQSTDATSKPAASVNHGNVMKALSEALKKTEDAYLDITDMMAMENPELALMGSCILVMLMKGEDVYVMNVGDSRAVLAQKVEPDFLIGHVRHDLERINEDGDDVDGLHKLTSLQLTKDHCTSVVGEVQRIKNEHQDDACAVTNDRVKGSLKVTRAFGAGFLKQPKWNNALLEMFRIDYVGTCPYISCTPSLYHHKLSSKDKFLILSSDGLYEYFTNQEAVNEVELFITSSPEGDPAQHLIEEVLFRAAKKAGMDFHELLDIPQGDRRRYHDDVSVIVISLEGRIWRSCV